MIGKEIRRHQLWRARVVQRAVFSQLMETIPWRSPACKKCETENLGSHVLESFSPPGNGTHVLELEKQRVSSEEKAEIACGVGTGMWGTNFAPPQDLCLPAKRCGPAVTLESVAQIWGNIFGRKVIFYFQMYLSDWIHWQRNRFSLICLVLLISTFVELICAKFIIA